MKRWFYSLPAGVKAALLMVSGVLAVLLVLLLIAAIIGWFGWTLLYLVPLAVAIWIVSKVCGGIYRVWAFLTDEFEQGDRQR